MINAIRYKTNKHYNRMPVEVFGKTYKSHGTAVRAVKKKKGWSDSRANAYVATVERKQRGAKK